MIWLLKLTNLWHSVFLLYVEFQTQKVVKRVSIQSGAVEPKTIIGICNGLKGNAIAVAIDVCDNQVIYNNDLISWIYSIIGHSVIAHIIMVNNITLRNPAIIYEIFLNIFYPFISILLFLILNY